MDRAKATLDSAAPRPLLGREHLHRMISPRTIAIVGASTTPGSFGLRTLENIGTRFPGKVFPVNPRYPEIMGLRCYGAIEDVPEVPDCVIVAVPGEHVEGIVERCA